MGWSATQVYDKNILEEDVQKIIDVLPEHLSSSLGNSRQSWGWSTGVDVNNPDKNKINISGSYSMSEDIAKELSFFLRKKLRSIGYKCLYTKYHW